ncbi:MAG TPA: transglycosylase domain-containing protein [Bacteroidia bacterium]|jgi:penicillin-binding protein 1A|nr:transglycosylase domain-containing protein [Bacteroidia bacterium]
MANPEKQRFKKYLRIFWIIVLIPIFLLVFFTFGAASGIFGKLPSFEELENPQTFLASEVYSCDNQVLGKYYVQNRSNIQYKDISPFVINGLIATEDARFYDHSGVDLRSLFRVFFKTFLGRHAAAGGGSTITQQLAKMLFPRDPKAGKLTLMFRKFKEWVIAARLERQYTKEELITMYLNRFDFINNAVGIQSASRVYFSTTPDSLKLEQAAMLVGMEKNPALYNPKSHPKTALERRNVVLSQMTKYNYLPQHKFDSIKKMPLVLHFRPENPDEGLASYFREYLRDNFLRKWCDEHRKPDGSKYDIYKDGLRIYTTLDSRMQQYGEEAMEENMKFLQPLFFKELKNRKNAPFDFRVTKDQIDVLMDQSMRRSDRYMSLKLSGMSEKDIVKNFNTPVAMSIFSWKNPRHALDTTLTPMDSIRYSKSIMQCGFCSIDPHTGYIKAWVGGVDHRFFKYDHVMVGKRQVGSTFKPFIYTLAVQNGYSPCYEMANVTVTIPNGDQPWTPKNADTNDDGKMMTLKEALAKSVDRIAASLTHQFSAQAVINLVRRMGIKDSIQPVVSLCLGTCEIPVVSMVGAYCTYANNGIWVQPTYVTRIEDKNGRVLDQISPKTEEALSPQDAYLMVNMMEGVVQYGTGERLRGRKYNLQNPIAGKTGTTQNCSDGWFIGITPNLVSGCWAGFEDRSVHFENMEWGQGASEALPVWAVYMIKVYANKALGIEQDADFEKPKGPLTIEVDCDKYKKEHRNNANNPFQ